MINSRSVVGVSLISKTMSCLFSAQNFACVFKKYANAPTPNLYEQKAMRTNNNSRSYFDYPVSQWLSTGVHLALVGFVRIAFFSIHLRSSIDFLMTYLRCIHSSRRALNTNASKVGRRLSFS